MYILLNHSMRSSDSTPQLAHCESGSRGDGLEPDISIVICTNVHFFNLLVGNPECAPLCPVQREGGAFTEPCKQNEKKHVHSDVQVSSGQAKSPQKKIPIFLNTLDQPEHRYTHNTSVD